MSLWPSCSRKNQILIPEGKERIILRHHKGAFVGCFSLRLRKNINWKLFKQWKENRYPHITEQMARDFTSVIMNHYDYITAAPPSARRHPFRYCVYDLASAISVRTRIPFVPAYLMQAGIRPKNRQEIPWLLCQSQPVKTTFAGFLEHLSAALRTAQAGPKQFHTFHR